LEEYRKWVEALRLKRRFSDRQENKSTATTSIGRETDA